MGITLCTEIFPREGCCSRSALIRLIAFDSIGAPYSATCWVQMPGDRCVWIKLLYLAVNDHYTVSGSSSIVCPSGYELLGCYITSWVIYNTFHPRPNNFTNHRKFGIVNKVEEYYIQYPYANNIWTKFIHIKVIISTLFSELGLQVTPTDLELFKMARRLRETLAPSIRISITCFLQFAKLLRECECLNSAELFLNICKII